MQNDEFLDNNKEKRSEGAADKILSIPHSHRVTYHTLQAGKIGRENGSQCTCRCNPLCSRTDWICFSLSTHGFVKGFLLSRKMKIS